MSHGDDVRRLESKFQTDHRYTNFGPVMQAIEVRGFRGVADLTIEIRSSVTALCGLNGTGKSTIAQLAVCGYRKPSTAALRRYYVKDFFPASAADPDPFRSTAQVVYSYAVERGAEAQRVTVTRASKEWSGYKRQPERACYYVGFTQFIPKVERRDFSIYSGPLVQLGLTTPLDEEVSGRIAAILGLPYDSLGFAEVTHRTRTAELAMATRAGKRYSENHMGFGEGRAVYMVTAMENAPAQSLFVLEEPETSLHGEAQERLGRYLVDVSARRGHQIVLTTHSSAILGQLSSNSIAYLRRDAASQEIQVTPGLATYQVDAYLRGDRAPGSRVLCVEDSFARQFAQSILRRCDRDQLSGVKFVEAGGADQVRQAVKILREAGLKAAGLNDGDMSDKGQNGVETLPGGAPPERVVFTDQAVKETFASNYALDLEQALLGVADHHDFAARIAARLAIDEPVVATLACDAYVKSRKEEEFQALVGFIRKQLF